VKGEAVLSTHRPLPPNAFGFPTLDSGAFNEWRTQALVCLKSLFGAKHTYVEHFDEQVKQGYQGTVKSGIGILKAAKEDLAQESQLPAEPAESNTVSLTTKVFVVHGHDDEMKQHVARTLSTLGLHPIILHEQPNGGRTIIEKFEVNADVSFAVVLLSPDDMAFPAASNAKQAKPRARQNVVLELGYFVGRLGRNRVIALKRGDLELPSDFSGVVYTPYDAAGHWRFELVRELKAVGYKVDANSLL
jgi:predicted nucleotide-binding protein